MFSDDIINSLLSKIQKHHFNFVGVNTPLDKADHIATQEALQTELSVALTQFYKTWCAQQQNRIRDKLEEFEGNARQELNDKLQREYMKNEEKLKMYVVEAQRIADWNPYDPNATADFFEPKYMFGVDGVDIAIGNPPYIRHEKIKHLKPALQKQFNDFFTSTADISTYFYKRAASILRDNGILVYICTNKFLRSDYGENLRDFLSEEMTILKLLDLGNVPIFKAAVDTCITSFLRCPPPDNHQFPAVTLRKANEQFNLCDAFQSQSFPIALTDLESDVWAIAPPDAQALLKKIKTTGKTLEKCITSKIYMGVKTGCNDAFIIDTDTRDRLIDEDAQSEELIKPFLRGANLLKWIPETQTEYLITIASSANREWIWTNTSSDEAEMIFKSEYPAVYRHLNQFREKLINRQDKGKYYWELRSCDYYAQFEKPKIIYSGLAKCFNAVYDTIQLLSVNSTYFIPTIDLSLLGILNSKLFDWYSRYKFQTLNNPWQGGGLNYFTQYMEIFPIADRTPEQKTELSQLVEQILDNPLSENVSDIEKDIDAFVYRLYRLSKKEISLIKQTYKGAGMT